MYRIFIVHYAYRNGREAGHGRIFHHRHEDTGLRPSYDDLKKIEENIRELGGLDSVAVLGLTELEPQDKLPDDMNDSQVEPD